MAASPLSNLSACAIMASKTGLDVLKTGTLLPIARVVVFTSDTVPY
jgi:hypothetical protein